MSPCHSHRRWFAEEGAWWGASFVFHALLMCAAMLLGNTAGGTIQGDAPLFEAADQSQPPAADAMPDKVETPETREEPVDTAELSVETLAAPTAATFDRSSQSGDPLAGGISEGGGRPTEANGLPNTGGLGGFTIVAKGPGPRVVGGGGVGGGIGTGTVPGLGGAGQSFARRGRKGGLGSAGGTRQSERAVAMALNWLARHQNYDGSWSFDGYTTRCTDATCTGQGIKNAYNAATALGLLPFLAAGQTHETKGPYQENVLKALVYLINHQKRDGDLRDMKATWYAQMYSHGLATICLCEAYGMTHDRALAGPAQLAAHFVETAQNPATGGWRYDPRPDELGDISNTGFQIMALKSAQMAYLEVDPRVLERASKYLDSVSKGDYHGKFCYMLNFKEQEDVRRTAIGLLCRQYLGMRRDDPALREGKDCLMGQQPHPGPWAWYDCYYFYYATQVMHHLGGPDWDAWNRKMRKVLIDAQCKNGCALGSWSPDLEENYIGKDLAAGRVYTTSLCALTLEVYYRHLPLYKLDNAPK